MKNHVSSLGLSLLFLIFSACSAAPVLKDYPTRQIDRPYTLPDGIATWQTYFAHMREHESDGDIDQFSLLYPLVWNQSLSDTWQLTWTPLPLLVSHELQRNETGYWGLTFGGAGGYGSRSGLILTPALGVKRRHRISPDFALDGLVTANFLIPFKEGDAGWSAGILLNPIFQVTDHLAVGPTVGLYSEEEAIWEVSFSADDFYIRENRSRRITVPVGVSAQWLFARQWEISFSDTLNRIGYGRNYWRNDLLLTLTHFW